MQLYHKEKQMVVHLFVISVTFLTNLIWCYDGSAATPATSYSIENEIIKTSKELYVQIKKQCPVGSRIQIGTNGDDYLRGTSGADCIWGLAGEDEIDGLGGNDILIGGPGNDVIKGGDGWDILYGGPGDDVLEGGRENDVINGDIGNDIIKGEEGNDIVEGDEGNDILFGQQGKDRLSGGNGNDLVYAGAGFDLCDAGNGMDSCSFPCAKCETISGDHQEKCSDIETCSEGKYCKVEAGLCLFCLADAECDDGNPCTDDSCHPLEGCKHLNNKQRCDDGNSCTKMDQCENGDCIGNNPVVCEAESQCNMEGTCDPQTGECSILPKNEDLHCDDGDRCTENDMCEAGVCVGKDPVECEPFDACHTDGNCNPITGECSYSMISCDDDDACTMDGCDPSYGCVSVFVYGPECDIEPPPDEVKITQVLISDTQLYQEKQMSVEVELEADAPRVDYRVEFILFPVTTGDVNEEVVGTSLGVRLFQTVPAGLEKYPVVLQLPASIEPGEYVLTAHEYANGPFTFSGDSFTISEQKEAPVINIVKITAGQKAILLDPENTYWSESPENIVTTPFSATIDIISHNGPASGIYINASIPSIDGTDKQIPLYFWDSLAGLYVSTLNIDNLPSNLTTSMFVEMVIAETDAESLRSDISEGTPIPTQIVFDIVGSDAALNVPCFVASPSSMCSDSQPTDAVLFYSTQAIEAQPSIDTIGKGQEKAQQTQKSKRKEELIYHKNFSRFAENDYVGAGLSFEGSASLKKVGYDGWVEAKIPLKIFDNTFDFAQATLAANAHLEEPANMEYKVTLIGAGTVVDRTRSEPEYELPLDFPLVSYEKSYGQTFIIFCVPVGVFIGARGTFGVNGKIKASSTLATDNAASLYINAGPYGDVTAFAGAGLGGSLYGYEFGVGAEADLDLVHASLTAQGGGDLDVVLNEQKIPVAVRGSLSESLNYSMNFLKGHIDVSLWVPSIKWCKKWGIPYPCGIENEEWPKKICSWPGYSIGPYTLLNESQDAFEIPLPVCETCTGKCGIIDDGCGNQLDCGGCSDPATCGGGGFANICGGGCPPPDCDEKCGNVPDSCNQPYNCGGCPDGMTCGGAGGVNVCEVPPCPPIDCTDKCGWVRNSCGNEENCGDCVPPETCGGGGIPNECGCEPNFDCTGRCGVVDVGCNAPSIDCGPCHDVGVIPGASDCPTGSELIEIKMDDEDNRNANSKWGWNGEIVSTANTLFRFCRVLGEQFLPLSQIDDPNDYYAVLKLSDECPPNSQEFGRRFDNEDSDNENWYHGNIAPNYSGPNTELRFCLFRSANATMSEFPDIGIEYGVFAPASFGIGIEFGGIHTDDEDSSNGNYFFGDSDAISAAGNIINGDENTNINMARVR